MTEGAIIIANSSSSVVAIVIALCGIDDANNATCDYNLLHCASIDIAHPICSVCFWATQIITSRPTQLLISIKYNSKSVIYNRSPFLNDSLNMSGYAMLRCDDDD